MKEFFESLRSLHRAVYSLNYTYGDPQRRALTQMLNRLGKRLMAHGKFDLRKAKDISFYTSLDDDRFLSMLYEASKESRLEGDSISIQMFGIILQRIQPKVLQVPISGRLPTSVEGKAAFERKLAKKLKINLNRIMPIGQPFESEVGFRMFGSEFSSYESAIRSRKVIDCTGLVYAGSRNSMQKCLTVWVIPEDAKWANMLQ